MAVQHKNLTGSQVHESKGVSAAAANTYNLALSGVNNWTTLYYDEQVTASASASIEFNDLAQFTTVCLSFDDFLFSSTSSDLQIHVSSDNGSTYSTAAVNYSYWNDDSSTAYRSKAATSLAIGNTIPSTVYFTGKLYLLNFNKALRTIVKGMLHLNSAANLGGTPNTEEVGGVINSATAWNALKIVPSSGTITSGTVTLEGLRG